MQTRRVRWSKDGTWDRVLSELQGQTQAAGELVVSVDSTLARAHQHAAGARRAALRGGEPHVNAGRAG